MRSITRLKNIQNLLRSDLDMDNHTILLKNGTVLAHDKDDKVTPTRADVLIQGNKIKQIGNVAEIPANAEVFDCTDKIVAPGFIE